MPFFTEAQRSLIEVTYGKDAEEYVLLLGSFGDFVEKEIAPLGPQIDREKMFPREPLRKLFDQGFTAMSYPKEYGGLELPYPVYVAAMEMVGKACASTSLSIGIHGTATEGVRKFGSEKLKDRYLGDLVSGKKLGAFCLTEPSSGSDAAGMRTQARLDGNLYMLNGSKLFITNGGEAETYFVFARTEKGHGAFVVEKGWPGFWFGQPIDKMGVRGSRLVELVFQNCKVPKENLVGTDGEGFEYAKQMLSGGRITIGAQSVGIAQAAYDKSLRYSRERTQFGQPLASFQMIQSKLAEMETQISAARALVHYAACVRDRREEFASEAAQAKLFASETALKVCDEAIQIHGGYGYVDEFDVHRHWRDARLMTIGEGTSEVMKMIISDFALKEKG